MYKHLILLTTLLAHLSFSVSAIDRDIETSISFDDEIIFNYQIPFSQEDIDGDFAEYEVRYQEFKTYYNKMFTWFPFVGLKKNYSLQDIAYIFHRANGEELYDFEEEEEEHATFLRMVLAVGYDKIEDRCQDPINKDDIRSICYILDDAFFTVTDRILKEGLKRKVSLEHSELVKLIQTTLLDGQGNSLRNLEQIEQAEKLFIKFSEVYGKDKLAVDISFLDFFDYIRYSLHKTYSTNCTIAKNQDDVEKLILAKKKLNDAIKTVFETYSNEEYRFYDNSMKIKKSYVFFTGHADYISRENFIRLADLLVVDLTDSDRSSLELLLKQFDLKYFDYLIGLLKKPEQINFNLIEAVTNKKDFRQHNSDKDLVEADFKMRQFVLGQLERHKRDINDLKMIKEIRDVLKVIEENTYYSNISKPDDFQAKAKELGSFFMKSDLVKTIFSGTETESSKEQQ